MTKMTVAGAVEARMTKVLLGLTVAATTLGLSAQAHACNARGEHCGRPTWAANAFSGPYNRVPESAVQLRDYQAARPSKPEWTERIVKKAVPLVKTEKVARVVPLVKFADGEGRQFDPASLVWFDGKSQCWSGTKQFTFKDGDWFYGKKEWAESKGSWKVASGDAPEFVSCESVPSFAAKANAVATKTATQTGKIEKAENADKGATSQPPPVTPNPTKIKTAESDTSAIAQKPVTTPASAECKKYFPSVGQMISVPCAE
ncbi:MAG: hypothetical protein ACKVP3_04850 [Hyphomicrobiaceae bacterium]